MTENANMAKTAAKESAAVSERFSFSKNDKLLITSGMS